MPSIPIPPFFLIPYSFPAYFTRSATREFAEMTASAMFLPSENHRTAMKCHVRVFSSPITPPIPPTYSAPTPHAPVPHNILLLVIRIIIIIMIWNL